MPTHAKERLIDAAQQLFYAEGIRAVGVDRLLTVSEIGRASFYRHFASKDDLVVAVLTGQAEEYHRWIRGVVEDAGGDPLAVFDGLAERFADDDFRGCASINAMVEIVDPAAAGHVVAARYKRTLVDYLDEVLAAAGYADHAELAEEFILLVDGANVTALRERTPAAAHRAKKIAAGLLGRDRAA
ncbi:TetR/AcrR family transcriptional regulator [Pseudonocardia sp. TRM90224]|uniref:TetR/AcrR family transcriptional regulator n=1 Tax=Pseudonocardia sp. TRM90224 TaxID=2812678 RepID=UPI001E2AB7F6|nr:TetR/AcrR family transcriptional regulator [Pseudonocardia sp. TRM90224]